MCAVSLPQMIPPNCSLFNMIMEMRKQWPVVVQTQEHLSTRGQALAMANTDTYAVVQKRRAPPGAEAGARARGAEEAPLYSQVVQRAQRPQAHAEDARGTLPGRVMSDQSPAGADTYEDVVDGAQTSRLGFNLRIGRPKGPRDPPAEWSQV
uniref:protein-tyrosine-phosphatase n=1 Tax=Suricata suricatta TaxID=37032 RepID=A0A673SX85_SURSU